MSASTLLIVKAGIFSFFVFCLMTGVSAAQSANDSTIETDSETINIYLDCSRCDYDFIRTEIDFVNYVRDRKQSDLHLLVTTRQTGSGGQEYTLTFIGQKDFKERNDTLVFVTAETDSDDKIRNRFVKTMKLGLVPYLTGLPVADQIDIKYVRPEAKTEVKDTWNHWVFSLSIDGWVNGEESYNSLWQHTDIEVNRVTEDVKLEFGLYNNYNEQNFDYGTVSYKYVSRSHGHYGNVIPSLTDHWSLAFSWDVYSSSYSNRRLAFALGTGIEYNIFPYQESTRRQLRLEYQLHYNYVDYEEKTIFYKYSEHTFREILSASLEIVQPWGKSNVTVSAANYLHDFDLYRLWVSGSISLNILEGLSLDLSGNASRVKDQLSLRLSEYAQEDILLRSKEIATSYRYWLSFGFTYSFGSIYTPIVNPRFGY